MTKYIKALLSCFMVLAAVTANAEEIAAVLEWVKRVELTTPVSGRVERVMVNVGDRVEKGKPLLQLDQREFLGGVMKAEAAKIRATEKHAEAKRELERAKELFERTVISIHELQLVKIDFATAGAELKDATASLNLAKLHLEYSTLRAPFKGRVLQRSVEVGQTVVTRLQAAPLIILAASDSMIARAEVSADVLANLSPGKVLEVKVAGKSYKARISSMGQEPVSGKGKQALYRLDVEFPVGSENFRKGQLAKIVIP
jgi:multidrug efflux system membrane fusion protein